MNMSKSKLLSLLLVGSASMTMGACGKKESKPNISPKQFKQSLPKKAIKPGGTLTYALENDSPFTGIFLTEIADTTPDAEAMSPGNEGLFASDDQFRITDKGAATLKLNHNSKTAEITVKRKVRWSDGHPVTAKDLEYAYEIIANPKVKTTRYISSLENIKGIAAYHAGKAKNISGIEMPDGPNGRRIILHFFELKPAMLSAGNVFFWDHAAPYHYLKNVPFNKLVSCPQVRKRPLFFGPYKMDNTVQGESTTWSRNPYYWRGKPNFEHIQMSTVSTSSTSQAIKSKKFDVADVSSMQYDQVKNTKDVNFLGQKSLLYSFISFKVGKWNENTGKNEQYKHSKMDNPALRKAMVYGMNVDQVDQRIFHGLRYRINSLIPTQFGAYHDKDIPVYSYNPAKANKLLDQAGYKKDKKTGYRLQPNGKKLTINLAVHVSNINVESLWTNYIQQWKKLGLKVRFYTGRPMEFNNWVNAVKSSDPGIDVLSNSWEPSGDPSPSIFYGERMPYNFGRFVSPTNTKLLNAIDSKKSFDTNYRIRKMHEWQRWMYEKAYVVPLSGTYSLVALNSKLTGWSLKPSANVWYEAGFTK